MTTPSRFATTTQLFRSAGRVIKRNPKLLLFPLASAAFFFFSPIVFVPRPQMAHELNQMVVTLDPDRLINFQDAWVNEMKTSGYPFLILFNLLTSFIPTFISVAFYNEIFHALDGEVVSLRGGMRFASRRSLAVIAWCLLESLVWNSRSLLINFVGWPGALVTLPFILVWSVATVFVVPILIRENNSNPLNLFRYSLRTLKKVWGESVIGFLKIQFVALLLCFMLGFSVMLGFELMRSPGQIWSVAVTERYFALGTLPVLWVVLVANNIYCCVLYIYASEGVVPFPFTTPMLDVSWRVKKP